MSPSESDLRAALRDGEGDDRPDVDSLLAHVRGRRSQRRTRVLSTAAAVVIVAGAAVGGATLWGGSDGGGPQAGSSPTAATSTGAGTSPSTISPAAHIACPGRYPARTGTLGRTSGTEPMFASRVATVIVCSYEQTGTASATPTASLVLTGSDATALTESIEHASTSRLKIMCPDIVSADKTQLAIMTLTAGGTQLPVVTTDVSVPNCNQPITNGTAVRYAWKPPADLASRIAALTARGNAGSTDPGTVTGPTSGATTGLPSVSTTSGKIGTPVR